LEIEIMTVFISHSTKNDDVVTRIAGALREAGIETWVDHQNIQPSEDWDESVGAALESCHAMVLVLSSTAARSQNVKVEWSFFMDLGKPIYPVLIETCKIPFRLRLLQYIDCSHDEAQGIRRLIAAVGGKKSGSKKLKRPVKTTAALAPITAATIRQINTLVVLSGHRDSVRVVAFSPDGARLASGSDDKNIRLWHVARQTEARTLIGHEGPVNAVAFSPDGTLMASAAGDRTARLWNIDKRYGITALSGHGGSANTIAFGGTLLASGAEDGVIRLWEPPKRTVIAEFKGHTAPVKSIVFNPGGSLLASGSFDQTVRLWDVAGRCEQGQIEFEHEVWTLAFSPDGSRLAVGLNSGGVALIDSSAQKSVGYIHYADYNASCVRSIAFSPDGSLLAIGSVDGCIRIWAVADIGVQKRALRTLAGHEGGVCSIAFSPDGTRLASAAHDHTIRLWGVSSSE
jgi:dipeptidyl aminopeptidase/acylaminoacyl peptidase